MSKPRSGQWARFYLDYKCPLTPKRKSEVFILDNIEYFENMKFQVLNEYIIAELWEDLIFDRKLSTEQILYLVKLAREEYFK